jgi:hypothetical protein
MSFVYNEHNSPLSSEQEASESSAASEQDGPSTPILLANGTQVWLRDLQFNLADNMEQCYQALTKSGLTVSPGPSADGTPWCNATWDTVLCWPATPGGQSVTLQCPPLKGLDPTSEHFPFNGTFCIRGIYKNSLSHKIIVVISSF